MKSAEFESNSFQICTARSTCRLLFFTFPKLQNKSKSADKIERLFKAPTLPALFIHLC